MTDLQNHVDQIAQDLSNPNQLAVWAAENENPDYSVLDYLDSALDLEFIMGNDGSYRGARVLVALGGPTIWIDTRTSKVEGSWWQESAQASFNDAIGLDDMLEELFICR